MTRPWTSLIGPTRRDFRDWAERNRHLVDGWVILSNFEFPDEPDPFGTLFLREMKLAVHHAGLLALFREVEEDFREECQRAGDVGEHYWKKYKQERPSSEAQQYYTISYSDGEFDVEITQFEDRVAEATEEILTSEYFHIAELITEEYQFLFYDFARASVSEFPDANLDEAVLQMTECVMESALVMGSLKNLEESADLLWDLFESLREKEEAL